MKRTVAMILSLVLLMGVLVLPGVAQTDLTNVFDTAQMTNGWVNATDTSIDNGFKTSHYIPVSPDDVITFGAAVTSQGWHFAIYDAQKVAVGDGRLSSGVAIAGTIDDTTSVMQYSIPDGVAYIRMVADSRYAQKYMVTINQPFSASDYKDFFNLSGNGNTALNNQFDPTDAFAGYIDASGNQLESPGFITMVPLAVKAGDVLTFGPAISDQGWHLVTLDSNKSVTGNGTIHNGIVITETVEGRLSVMQYTIPQGVAWIRMVVDTNYVDRYVLTLNQSFTAADLKAYWQEQETTEKPDETNPLFGKTALFAGDSICYGQWDSEPRQGWAGRIATAYGMTAINAGIGGTTISNLRPGRIVDQLHANKDTSFDYVILQGGTNDGWGDLAPQGNTTAPVGTLSDSFALKDFDLSTFAGGLEELFFYAKQYFPNAKLGFITTFATPLGATQNLGRTGDMSEYYDMALKVCEKWGIQVLDLFHDRYVSDELMKVNSYTCLQDPLHPNAKGYDNLAPYIGEWMSRMVDNKTYQENPFVNKRALFVGDSISYGHADSVPGTAWAGRIAKSLNMIVDNYSKSGWSISTIRSPQIVTQLTEKKNNNYDYVIMHGGVNDAWDQAPVGEISNTFQPSKFVRSTFAGALEHLFYTAYTEFPEAKLGYILNFATPRADVQSYVGNLKEMEPYYQVAIEICRKWQVAYLDLYHDDYVNNVLLEVNTNKYVPDGVHPNSAGYDRLSPYIEKWLKTIPYANTNLLKNRQAYEAAFAAGDTIDAIGVISAENYTEKLSAIEEAESAVALLHKQYGEAIDFMIGNLQTLLDARKAYQSFAGPQTPEYTLGDVDDDGVVNAVDALWTLQAAVQKRELTQTQTSAADMNQDGKLDATDALKILQKAVGK